MFCMKCGAKLDETVKFCVFCGAKIVPAAGTAPAADASAETVRFPVVEDSPVASKSETAPLPENWKEDTLVFYAPSVLPTEPETEQAPNDVLTPEAQAEPDAEPQAFDDEPPPPETPVYTPVVESYTPPPAPPPNASVIVQSTATVLQGATQGVALPEPPSKPQRTRAKRAVAAVLSVLLSMVFFAAASAALLLSCGQSLLAPDNLPKLAEQIDLKAVLEELDVAGQIMDGLDPYVIGFYGIRERNIVNLLSSPAVKTYAVGELTSCLEALARGDTDYTLDKDNLLDFVQDNALLIEAETGYRMSATDYERLRNALETPEAEELLNLGTALSTADLDPIWLELLLSRVSLIVLLSLCGLLILLLFVVNRRQARTAFLYMGIPLLLDGLIFTMLGLVLHILFRNLTDMGSAVLMEILSPLRSVLSYSGLIVFASGLLCVGVYLLLRRTGKKQA